MGKFIIKHTSYSHCDGGFVTGLETTECVHHFSEGGEMESFSSIMKIFTKLVIQNRFRTCC